MARSIFFGSTLVLTCALTLPVSAGAQAVARPSTSGSSSSGSSGSSGAGSSGAGTSGSSGGEISGSRISGSGGGSGVDGRSSAIDNPRSSGRTAPASGGSRSTSSASRDTGRAAPAPGGFAQRGSGGVGDPTSSGVVGLDLNSLNSRVGTGTGRTSNGSNVLGVAAARTFDLTPVSFPFYGPWGQYYPWFGSGLGYGYGYLFYDPWRYSATSWLWGRYGMWYDPWGYNPYGSTSYSSSGYSSSVRDVEPKRTGNIRLKANEKKAKVYVDGALVGVVDEFDGLSDHLELEGGPHQLELRAEGFEPYIGVLVVEAGKTMTERVSLKRVKK